MGVSGMIINRFITIAALLGGGLSLIMALILGAYIPAIFAAALFTISIFMWKYGYLLFPHLSSAANIVEVRGSYTIPPERDYVLKKSSDRYHATKFLEIMLYESTMDKNEGEKRLLFESFEKAVCSMKHPLKMSFLLAPIDVSKYIDDIKTKRSEAEEKKSKLQPQSPDTVRLDREITMWTRQIDRLTAGERPMEVIAYASTTASAATKDEAVARARRQAQELKTILSSTLSASVKELSDLDMVRCFEWEYFIPEQREDLMDEVF
ncbi:hypothetical protein KJ780_01885 [Candidatus Micrarchaeota archaeon]|nr:hypothetical protein [Candidatus Micrarchaeota archaeon]